MKNIFVIISLLLMLSFASFPSTQAQSDPIQYATLFDGHEGTFLLYDQANDTLTIYNPDRASQQFPPFSTFKILNAAIGLETGVIADQDFVIEWDQEKYPRFGSTPDLDLSSWWQDHDLQSAMVNSVVWYFFDFALDVGQERMQQWVSDAHYGNQDVSVWIVDTPFGEERPFWLGGGLEISAIEQMAFLRDFFTHNLPFSERTVDIVEDIIILESNDDYILRGKTGTRSDLQFGWIIGTIERDDNLYFYVLNIDAEPQARNGLLRELLNAHGPID